MQTRQYTRVVSASNREDGTEVNREECNDVYCTQYVLPDGNTGSYSACLLDDLVFAGLGHRGLNDE